MFWDEKVTKLGQIQSCKFSLLLFNPVFLKPFFLRPKIAKNNDLQR